MAYWLSWLHYNTLLCALIQSEFSKQSVHYILISDSVSLVMKVLKLVVAVQQLSVDIITKTRILSVFLYNIYLHFFMTF